MLNCSNYRLTLSGSRNVNIENLIKSYGFSVNLLMLMATIVYRKLFDCLRPGLRLYATDYAGMLFQTEKSINRVTLLGRVENPPEVKGSEEKPVTVFSIATTDNSGVNETGEIKPRTVWHRVVVFRPHLGGNVHKYLKKGSQCLVKGKLMYGVFRDEAGNDRPISSIQADNVIFLQNTKDNEIELQ